jgi:hypothetical protein
MAVDGKGMDGRTRQLVLSTYTQRSEVGRAGLCNLSRVRYLAKSTLTGPSCGSIAAETEDEVESSQS